MTSTFPQSRTDPLDGHRAAVARMLLVFPISGQENSRDVADAYVSVLRSLPLWAVAESCEQFAKGLVERKVMGLRPAVDLVYDHASDLVARRHREAEREERLRLPPPAGHPADDPAMRQRVLTEIEKWDAWKFSRAEQRKAEPSPDREAQARRLREQWARSVEADGGDPNRGEIPVSPALERLVRASEREAGDGVVQAQ